ncbi:MAG: beta-lactamase family protein [Trueperaceae bacterium]|nr:beta-lactamase family protein [Trueperaceae bacterium]
MQAKNRTVQVLRIIMPIVAIVCIIVIPPLDLVPLLITPLPDTIQAQIEDGVERGLDGVIVYVDQAGKPPAFYAAGWKNKMTREPANPHALFKIGSIHKLYIATAIAKLVSDGRLSLDDTLASLLPELKGRIENSDDISLKMMVQHRSGIPNFTDDEAWDWFAPQTDETKKLELILDEPADFKPDARYRYSNTNYLLLGLILDKVLGYSHHQYIYNEILAPLGLTNTFFTLNEVDIEEVVSGYWYGYDDDLRFLGGSMIATAQDVGLFLRALNDGSLLNDEEQAIYTLIYEYDHTGWVPGYHSIARYHDDIDTVVIQFVNTTGGETWGVANIIGGKATGISTILYNRILRILRR